MAAKAHSAAPVIESVPEWVPKSLQNSPWFEKVWPVLPPDVKADETMWREGGAMLEVQVRKSILDVIPLTK